MPALRLLIGNKNYSSWSLRAWVLMTETGIPFEEELVAFDDMAPGSPFKTRLAQVSPVGQVPVLLDGPLAVWDTLAIAETLAERFPDKALWPADPARRARARSVCAEMHAGFGALRNHCPMNVEASFPEIGERVLREQPAVRRDLDRIVAIWTGLLAESGGPMLFGDFGIADAFFAPVVLRLRGFALPVPDEARAYMDRVLALPSMTAWIAAALAEKTFVAFDEPYRTSR